MIVSERNPYRDWIFADLLADNEAGELVAGDEVGRLLGEGWDGGWTDLHGRQAAATP